MYPILFSLGQFHFRVYGLLLAASFLLGSWLTLRRGARLGLDEKILSELFGWIMLAAVVGARIHFVLAHPHDFPRMSDAFRIWEGGLTEYGGLIGAVLASAIYLRVKRIPFYRVADLMAPVLALGEGITRIGCFFNGCCFGRPTRGWFSLHFPNDSYAALTLGPGVAVWPAQLVLSACGLVSFFLLLRLERPGLRPGALFGLYLLFQGAARYLVDFERYYDPGDRFAHLGPLLQTHSQLVALLLAAAGVVLVIRGYRRTGPAAEGKVA